MNDTSLVIIGAISGAVLRWKVTSIASKYGLIPWSTAAINIAGSFALGAVVAKSKSSKQSLLLGTGFCGAFTTFSAFSIDVVDLIDNRQYGRAVSYVLMSNLAGIGSAALAYKLFKR